MRVCALVARGPNKNATLGARLTQIRTLASLAKTHTLLFVHHINWLSASLFRHANDIMATH